MIEIALSRPIDVLFLEFSEPIAAASIAQVHKATIRTAASAALTTWKRIQKSTGEARSGPTTPEPAAQNWTKAELSESTRSARLR